MNTLLAPVVSLCLAASVVAVAPSRGFADPPPEVERFAALAEAALETEYPEVALAALLELGAYQRWLAPQDRIDAYDALASALTDPDAVAIASYAALRASAAIGDVDEVRRREAAAGFVTQWSVIGPFANDGMAGLHERYGPERDGPGAGPYPGKVVDVAWAAVPTASQTGYLDLGDVVQPTTAAVAYVATAFEAPRAGSGEISLAVDGAYRVWLNGEPLAEQADHLGGFAVRDRVPARWTRGTNTLVVKIATQDAAMGLHARILDANGAPLQLPFRPATAGPALEPADAWPRVATLFDDASFDGDPRRAAAAAYVLREMMPTHPDEPWLDLLGTAEAAPNVDAASLLRLSRVVTESWRADQLLARAEELAPDDPWVAIERSEALSREMGRDARQMAIERLRPLAERPRPVASAALLLADLQEDDGFPQSAFAARAALRERYGDRLPLLTALHASAWDVHREDLQVQLALAIVAQQADALGYYDDALVGLRARGDNAAASTLLQRARRLLPLSGGILELVAEEARALGRTDDAMAALDAAVALCPGDAGVLEARGRYAVELGRSAAAADDFGAALALSPQDTTLRGYLAALGVADTDDRFWTPYRIDDHEVLALRDADTDEGEHPWEWLVNQRVTRVYPNGLTTSYVQHAYAVRSRSGADELRGYRVPYAPDSERVDIIGVRVIGPDGMVREVYETSDYGSQNGPASIYFDVRTRAVYVNALEPGDVLVLEYTVADIAAANMFDDYFGEVWFVNDQRPTALARYTLLSPTSRELFSNREALSLGLWHESVDGDVREVQYEARQLGGVRPEPAMPGASEVFEYISVSTYGDWDALANWYWALIDDQLVSSPEIRDTVAEITDGLTDERDRVAAVYEYVVRNTRYVGLEFGIHGFKPYRTTDCFNRRFGDCKDTASLMKVMLAEAGIEAHVALVRTHDMGTIAAHPPSLAVFNHAITYVPALDLFLDGTAGFSGSGELPSADQGASSVIILDGEGGRFTTIDALEPEDSLSSSVVRVDLGTDTGSGGLRLTGAFAPPARRNFEVAERRVERLEEELSWRVPGISVQDATFVGTDDIEREVGIGYTFTGGDWLRDAADGRELHPFADYATLTSRLAGLSHRETDLRLEFRYMLHEHFEFTLPDGMPPPELPEYRLVESPFGDCEVNYRLVDGKVITAMTLRMTVRQVPSAEYPAFREFIAAAQAALDRPLRFPAEAP